MHFRLGSYFTNEMSQLCLRTFINEKNFMIIYFEKRKNVLVYDCSNFWNNKEYFYHLLFFCEGTILTFQKCFNTFFGSCRMNINFVCLHTTLFYTTLMVEKINFFI